MKNYIVRALSDDGGVRAFVAVTTELCNEAQRVHQTYPVASAALGRLLTGGAMMGTMLKGEKDAITLQIKGDGPLGGVVVLTDASANVKGYVHHPQIEIPSQPNGKLDVGGAIGYGTLTIIRDFGMKEPYVGQVPLMTGEIAEDLTLYFAQSEQTPSAVALGVLVDRDLSVRAAGGFIIQLMPDAHPKLSEMIEKAVQDATPISTLVDQGLSGEEILHTILPAVKWSKSERIATQYQCDCSTDRIERALISLGAKELGEIITEQGQAELTCHFCTKRYHFDKDALVQLLASATSRS
ncbi:MAG: Hsp33 family molecular chaperone HslO [Hyphomonadaceae bacterium]|nr:Hsp33 family molecular chaperone HslO [Clostridia bacterium]